MKEATYRALNRLAKWRSLLTGWQVGTRPLGDAESDAIRDMQEFRLLIRVEVSSLARVLVAKGIMTEDEFDEAMEYDALLLDEAMTRRFPGMKSSDEGLVMNPAEVNRAGWMKGWPL